MKKYILFFLLLIISVAVRAAEKIPGQIVVGNTTEEVTFLIPVGFFGGGPGVEAMQTGIRYIDSKGKKHRLKPEQASEFHFKYEGREYRMVSQQRSGNLFSRAVFMLLVIDGKVRMFEYTVTSQSSARANGTGGIATTTTYYLLQKPNEQLYEPRMIGFKKGMTDYFSDCPKLVEMIDGKEFKRRDLDEIVIYYNTKCN